MSMLQYSTAKMYASPSPPPPLPSLEELAYRYGTDKSHDDHKYVDMYEMLFGSIRYTATNITEVGVATGQSLQVWHDYFPRAHIWGLDLKTKKTVREVLHSPPWAPRMHILEGSSQARKDIIRVGLANDSMDIIIDDGEHTFAGNQRTLLALWPALRAGGYFCIEDVSTGADSRTGRYERVENNWTKVYVTGEASGKKHWVRDGISPLVHSREMWSTEMRRIFEENDVFFADTSAGHRDFDQFLLRARRADRTHRR